MAAPDWHDLRLHAGTDTTCFLVSRAFQLLSRHPSWLEKLRDEQQAIMQQHGTSINATVRLPSGLECKLMTPAVAESRKSAILFCMSFF